MVRLTLGCRFEALFSRGDIYFDTPWFLSGAHRRPRDFRPVWSMERTPGCLQVWAGHWEVTVERRHLAPSRP